MAEDVSKWILEFLLRRKFDEKLINGLLESLPLKDENNHRLKKTLLLRKIELEASSASISEKILDFLEIIEEIDHREGKSAPDLMKKAYCDVAVDCTVRFLDEKAENNDKYFEVVKRVWRERVCKIEVLASEESKRRFGGLEAAVWDSAAYGEVMRFHTSEEALRSVRIYLEESHRSLGPPILELVAEKVGNALLELCGGDGDPLVGPAAEPSHAVRETLKARVPLKRKHIAVKGKGCKGTKISDLKQGNEDKLMGNGNDNPGLEMHAPGENIENCAEKENPTGSTGREAGQHQMKLRNLMKPNDAHTYEWEDSIENLPEGSSKRLRLPSCNKSKRLRLPSCNKSKRLRLPSCNKSKPSSSTLKGDEYTKITRRRVTKKWTPLEEETLRTGVKKFDKGSWKLIWHSYREIFGERTEGDLKDKWRNMSRS